MTLPHYRPEYFERLQKNYWAQTPSVWKRVQIILEYLQPNAGDVILETGCGQGTIAYELARRCASLCAVDNSAEAIDASRSFMDSIGWPQNLLLLRADLAKLPFASNLFTKVNFSEVVEHLERPAEVISELRRVLRPGGRMAVTTWPNRAHLIWSRRYRNGRGSAEDFNPHTPQSLRILLVRAGFGIVSLRLSNFYLSLPRTRWEIDGCSQENLVARFCERILVRRPLGTYLATSINILCRKV